MRRRTPNAGIYKRFAFVPVMLDLLDRSSFASLRKVARNPLDVSEQHKGTSLILRRLRRVLPVGGRQSVW